MSQQITIPLHVARAGLTEEYVEAWKRIYEVREMYSDKYKECTKLKYKMQKLMFWQHGTHDMKSPAEIKWIDALAAYEMMKEFVELTGQHTEINKELSNLTGEHGILASINKKASKFKEEE